MVNVIPERDVLAKKFLTHAVIQAGALVENGGPGKIQEKGADDIEDGGRLQDRGVVAGLQNARIARGDSLVARGFGEFVRMDITDVGRTRFGPAGRFVFQNGDREFGIGVLMAGEKPSRVPQNGLMRAAGKNSRGGLLFLIGHFANAGYGAGAIHGVFRGRGVKIARDLLVFLWTEDRQQIGIFRLVAREGSGGSDPAATRW